MIKKLWDRFVNWLFDWQKKCVNVKTATVIVIAMETYMQMIMVYVLAITVNVMAKELINTQKIMD